MEDQHAASHRLSMAQLQTMEFKQAFEEFDKVTKSAAVILTKKTLFCDYLSLTIVLRIEVGQYQRKSCCQS